MMPPPPGLPGLRSTAALSRSLPRTVRGGGIGHHPSPRPARETRGSRFSTTPAAAPTSFFPALLTLLGPRTPRRPLSPSGKASAATAAYILPAGIASTIAPVSIFSLLFPPTLLPPTPWLRLIGLLAATFGAYYAGAALEDATPGVPAGFGFKAATVVGRVALAVGLAWLGATTGGATGRGFCVFAALNAVGGVAMGVALGKEMGS